MPLRTAVRSLGCANCRLWLLNSFTSGLSAPLGQSQTPIARRIISSVKKSRFSSAVVRLHELPGGKDELASTVEDEAQIEATENIQDSNQSSQSDSDPWYLQVMEPPRIPQEVSDRQRLPDLPVTPPPILQPLLQQISVDLGLDYLSILDLRKLDPPPALGANLLMILGTARSEKHLHVAADRLCRWLRSTYKLRPDADGLLGRNELQLKLRRKARKAKLLGSIPDDNGDDGVRTGWVCVNVGAVDGAENDKPTVQQQQDFVGVGRRREGVRIVVQMLTEEKREEVDLEKLWCGILRRNLAAQEDVQAELSTGDAGNSVYTPISAPSRPAWSPDKGHVGLATQLRTFSTSAYVLMAQPPHQHSPSHHQSDAPNAEPIVDAELIWGRIKEALRSGSSAYNLQEDLMRLRSSQRQEGRSHILKQMMRYLENCARDSALKSLGSDIHDRTSSPYLTYYFQAMTPIPSDVDWTAMIWLYCYARRLGHENYDVRGLLDLLDQVQLSGERIPITLYHILLRGILTPVSQSEEEACIAGAVKIIQVMHEQGLDLLNEDIFVLLQESMESHTPPDEKGGGDILEITFGLRSYRLSPVQRRVHITMAHIDMPPLSDESMIRLMEVYARGNHWYAFWDVWRWPLRRIKTHPSLMYRYMFRKIAETRETRACVQALQTWVPDMERSRPAVKITGDVADAIQKCLLVIDPDVGRNAAADPKARGTWLDLWRKCEVRPG